MLEFMTRRLGFLTILLGLISIGILAVSVWGFRANDWPWPRSYDLARWGAWVAIASLGLALVAVSGWLLNKRGGVLAALLGLVLSLPVAGLGVAFEITARTTPPINDISTDTQDPPVFWFTATPTDYPAQNAVSQHAAYPDLGPLGLQLSEGDAFKAAMALVSARGWEVLSADPEESQIEAIARSRLFGFEDEVAIRFSESETGTRIDMRSRSRIGLIDRGANARRIEAFLADLAQQATK